MPAKQTDRPDTPHEPSQTQPNVSYADFPASSATAPGMKTVPGHYDAMGGVYFENVEYVRRNGQPLYLQVLTPARWTEPNRKYPLVIYIPGSGWRKQNVYFAIPMIAPFMLRGYTVALMQYRDSDTAGFPAQIQDAKTAVRFMKKNADRFAVDPNYTFIWGGSSGGHTAVMAGITQHEPALDTDVYSDVSCAVDGIIDYFGGVDIGKIGSDTMDHDSPQSFAGMFLGGVRVSEHPELVEPTVITNHIHADRPIPPILIMHGNKDRMLPFEQSVLLYNDLLAKGKDAELYMLDGADHSGPAFWHRETLDIVENFVRRVIREKKQA